MTKEIFSDMQTGGYWVGVLFINGMHKVIRWYDDINYTDEEEIFTGFFEECIGFIGKLIEENVDYDFNL